MDETDNLINCVSEIHTAQLALTLNKALINPLTVAVNEYNSTSIDTMIPVRKPVIMAINVDQMNDQKYMELTQAIEEIAPDMIWIMEPWKEIDPYLGYTQFCDTSVYYNCLWIKSELLRGRIVQRIKYGIQFDIFHFRYIPPHSKVTELYDVEIGDYNARSNYWIPRNAKYETRYNQSGGMLVKSSIPFNARQRYFTSDHKLIVAKFEYTMSTKLPADINKVKIALDIASVTGKIGTNIYKNVHAKTGDVYMIDRKSGKIVDPIKNNLTLEPWNELYGNNIHKPLRNRTTQVSNGPIKSTHSKAYDYNNKPSKYILDSVKEKNMSQLQNIVNALSINEQFTTKCICLRKKDKIPNTVLNLRPIQVEPITMKIGEQTRSKLKNWLINNTDPRCIAFMPGKSTTDVFQFILDKFDNG